MYLSDAKRLRPAWWSTDPQARLLERQAGTACQGVRVLQRLTRLTPIQRQLLAKRKIAVIPQLFAMKRQVEAERKAGNPIWRVHYKNYRDAVAKGFGRDYFLSNEADELARARCELARATVDAWETLSPAAVAARVAKIPATEKERLERKIEDLLKKPAPKPPAKRSFSQLFWNKVDERVNAAMQRTGVPQRLRGPVRNAVRSAIEKGASEGLGRTLEQLGVSGETKEAIEGVVKGVLQSRGL